MVSIGPRLVNRAAGYISAENAKDSEGLAVRQPSESDPIFRVSPAAAQQAPIAYPPCSEAEVGLCNKLRPGGWDRAANWAIAANGVCAGADLATTMFGIGRGVLHERNPLLEPLSHSAPKMALAKGGMTAGVSTILFKTKKSHPILTTLTAIGLASFQCWAAGNNHREANR